MKPAYPGETFTSPGGLATGYFFLRGKCDDRLPALVPTLNRSRSLFLVSSFLVHPRIGEPT